MELVMTTVADLHIGDLLLLPPTGGREPKTVEVRRLQHLPRSGNTRVWVVSPYHQRSLFSQWNLGAFEPDAPIQRIEFP